MTPFLTILLLVVSSIFISPASKTRSLTGYTFNISEKTTPFALELNPFSTDGCSRYPDGTRENPSLWRNCCVEHDVKYWLGGTSKERKNADKALYQCVKDKGETSAAEIIYVGVRSGGSPLNQTTYRWGYGWNRVRDYKVLSSQEKEMAYQMYGENLERLKNDIKQNKYVIHVPDSYVRTSPFPYSYCEEQIINYLSPKLSRDAKVTNATVTESHDFEAGSVYTISIHLDICEQAIEFEFNPKTNAETCKKDFAYAKVLNRIMNIRISKDCRRKL